MKTVDKDPCDSNCRVYGDHTICDVTKRGGLEDPQQEEANRYLREGYECFIC